MKLFLYLTLALSVIGFPSTAKQLPIFDAHIHYNQNAWEDYSPERVRKIIRRAGVIGGIVSSTPHEGTIKFFKKRHYYGEMKFFVPFVRPYFNGGSRFNWSWREENVKLTEEIIKRAYDNMWRPFYRGIGEVHVGSSVIFHSPEFGRYVDIILRHDDMMFYMHSVAYPVEFLFKKEPKIRILWAHAGRRENPKALDTMLSKYPRSQLMLELSLRADDIVDESGAIKENWKKLLIKHSDRFMIGSDTHSNSRWKNYGLLIGQHRNYLKQLPNEIAEAIAYRNAFRLFGIQYMNLEE